MAEKKLDSSMELPRGVWIRFARSREVKAQVSLREWRKVTWFRALNLSRAKRLLARTLLPTSSPGRFSLALTVRPTSKARKKRPGDEGDVLLVSFWLYSLFGFRVIVGYRVRVIAGFRVRVMVWKMKVVGTIYGTHMLVKARRVFPRSVVKRMHVIIILRSIKKEIMTLTFYCPYVLRWFG